MEKNASFQTLAETDEDFLIDLGAASVETRGAGVEQIEDEGLPSAHVLAE